MHCLPQGCSNVVRMHEVYEDAQHVYIVMENCKGGDLETLLEVRCVSTPLLTPSKPVLIPCLNCTGLAQLWRTRCIAPKTLKSPALNPKHSHCTAVRWRRRAGR